MGGNDTAAAFLRRTTKRSERESLFPNKMIPKRNDFRNLTHYL